LRSPALWIFWIHTVLSARDVLLERKPLADNHSGSFTRRDLAHRPLALASKIGQCKSRR
jgi:hypothetical protein